MLFGVHLPALHNLCLSCVSESCTGLFPLGQSSTFRSVPCLRVSWISCLAMATMAWFQMHGRSLPCLRSRTCSMQLMPSFPAARVSTMSLCRHASMTRCFCRWQGQ